MDFSVLGPVDAHRDGRELRLGGAKQRALLAMLLLHPNEVVSRDRLIDGLWGERPPTTAAHTLDNYVSRLRTALGEEQSRLSRRPPGFSFQVEPDELDLDRFERLVSAGREQLRRGETNEAATTLRRALGLWQGAALANVLDEPFAAAEAGRLEDRRILALEDRIEADLACGWAGELVPELERLIREEPLRERLLGQLMLALYRAGRQADALSVFQSFRRRLTEELGLEPGPQLQVLQRKILGHDPSLSLATQNRAVTRTWSRPSRRWLTVAALGAVLATGAIVGIIVGTRGVSASNASGSASGIVGLGVDSDKTGPSIGQPGAPAALVGIGDSVWSADPNSGSVSRIDLASRSVADRVPVGGTPGALAIGGGSVWAASVPGDHVTRIDPVTGEVTQTIPLGGGRAGALSFGAGSLWIADIVDNSLLEVDPNAGTVRRSVRMPFRPTSLVISRDTIWVAGYQDGEVEAVDRLTGQPLATIRVGNGPTSLAVGFGAVWVTNSLDSTVSKIDPSNDSVSATIAVGSGPSAIAVAGGSVWAANRYSASVSRIDPRRNTVVRTVRLQGNPTTLASAGGTIFAGVGTLAKHRGGKLVLLHSRPISIDPALNADLLTPVSDGLTGDPLVSYNHVGGPAGIQLVPDLAVAIPIPTDGGRTYTFRLRPGIRYSDGRPLRTADFRRGLERLFRLGADGGLFSGIRGVRQCSSLNCDLSSGIVTDEAARTVTFHLQAPDPGFLNNLASHGLGVPVPSGTPMHNIGFTPVPGTGPYKIANANSKEIHYVRNPYFHEWSHAAQPDGNPDEIVTRFGLRPEQEVREIELGRADWLGDNPPARLLPGLHTRFAGRLHGFSIPTTDFFQFNTTLRPFDDIRVRRALNLALDRQAIVRIYGGLDLATPTCQILAPGIVGYRLYCPYTLNPSAAGTWSAPDLAKAQRLVAASGTRGTAVTVWGWTDDATISPRVIRYVAAVLEGLGYRADVRLVPHSFFDRSNLDVLAGVQLIAASWGDPAFGFFATWLTCGSFGSHGYFCDPTIDRAIARNRTLESTDPRLAAAGWAALDRRLVDLAAWAPMINEHNIDFISARVQNYQAHPYWGILADQVWLRSAD